MSGGGPSSTKQSPQCAARVPVLSRSCEDRVGATFDFKVYGLVLRFGTAVFVGELFGTVMLLGWLFACLIAFCLAESALRASVTKRCQSKIIYA